MASEDFSSNLISAIQKAEREVLIFSAFIKLGALRWLLDGLDGPRVKVVARWQKRDLLCGMSDFECYDYCREKNIPFGIKQELHGKVFTCDGTIFVGSANLTARGMALNSNHNQEFGVGFEAGAADLDKLAGLLRETVWLEEPLAERMRTDLDDASDQASVVETDWSLDISQVLSKPSDYLWVHEILMSPPQQLLYFDAENDHHVHDLNLLGIPFDELSLQNLATAFRKSRLFIWLDRLLEVEQSLSFGSMTAQLHSKLLDDPSPYRRDVKKLVANLFAWAELLPDRFVISRPRHSQVIRRV